MIDVSSEDPRISNLLDDIDRDLVFIEVIGREFTDEVVYLDGRFWDDCTFRHCQFISRTGLFRMGTCEFIEHVGAVLHGPAARLFELLKANEDMGGTLQLAADGFRGPTGPVN